jgi:hypothetical protein
MRKTIASLVLASSLCGSDVTDFLQQRGYHHKPTEQLPFHAYVAFVPSPTGYTTATLQYNRPEKKPQELVLNLVEARNSIVIVVDEKADGVPDRVYRAKEGGSQNLILTPEHKRLFQEAMQYVRGLTRSAAR